MFTTFFALTPSELGVSSLTINSILASAGLILIVIPFFFVLRAQKVNPISAFSKDSRSSNVVSQVSGVETSPQLANQSDIEEGSN